MNNQVWINNRQPQTHYIAQIPVVGTLFDRDLQHHQEQSGTRVDFSKGWWHPPVSPRAVFDSEASQITKMGLSPIVSVTDHDSIEAGLDWEPLENLRLSASLFHHWISDAIANVPVTDPAEISAIFGAPG